MTSNTMLARMLMIATAAALIGCTSPTSTQPSNSAPAVHETHLPPHEVLQGDRQLLVAGISMNFEEIRANLPERISEAEASRLLTTLDPSRVKQEANFSLQSIRGGYGYGGYGRGYSRYTYGRGFYGGFGRSYAGYRYYGYGGYYFPYAYRAGYYYPYTYNAYYPFFYGYRGYYYPFYCY